MLDGRYALESELGRGGMGQVFRGRDLRLSRTVAVKILRHGLQSAEAVARFAQEARTASALAHPNILSIFDAGAAGGRPYLVSELLQGETLRHRLGRGALPLRDALMFATLIARGMAAAHEQGIVHRDLKPDNVFITTEGWVKILDFGISKILDGTCPGHTRGEEDFVDDVRASFTSAGSFLGTPGYAAPEQIRGQSVDVRADIFSFGALVCEMISGSRAFQKGNRQATLEAVLEEEPAPLSQDVPRSVRELLAACLQKQPQNRPQSARDVVGTLEHVLQELRITDYTPASTNRVYRPRTRRIRPLLVIVAAFGLALGAWFKIKGVPDPRERPQATRLERRYDELARKATASRDALRLFRAGEIALHAGDDLDALESFRAATVADPQFGLAFFRVATTARYGDEAGLARDAIRHALKAASKLEPRERALLDAQAAADEGRIERALELYRSITDEHPDDVEALTYLANLLFVYGPIFGWPVDEATDALRRALVLSPFEVESLRSLINVAQVQGQRHVVSPLIDRLIQASARGVPLDVRWASAWAHEDEAGRVAAVDEAVDGGQLDAQQVLFLRASWGDAGLADSTRLVDRLIAREQVPRRAFWAGARAILQLARGRPSDARATLLAVMPQSRDSSLSHFAAWIDTLDFVEPTPAQLAAARDAATYMDATRLPGFALLRLYLEGVLAIRAGDIAAADNAIAALEATKMPDGTTVSSDLALAIRARILAAAGDQRGALRALEKQSLRIGEHDANDLFTRISEQRLRSTLLEALGRPAEAERWQVFTFDSPLEIPLAPARHLRLCELLSARRAFAPASDHARFTLAAWSSADPEMKPQVERARRCLERAVAALGADQ